jgi:DnaJ-class molecular chaperone
MRCSCDDIGESPCEEHGYGELDCECGTRFHAPIVAKSFLLIQCPDCGHKYTGREDCGNGHWETVLPCGSCDGTGQIKERRDDVYCDPAHDCEDCKGTGDAQGSVSGTDAVCMRPVSAGGMTCPDCDGRGHGLVYPENKCGFCGGTGHVLRDHK